jgi:hypothetical protein
VGNLEYVKMMENFEKDVKTNNHKIRAYLQLENTRSAVIKKIKSKYILRLNGLGL